MKTYLQPPHPPPGYSKAVILKVRPHQHRHLMATYLRDKHVWSHLRLAELEALRAGPSNLLCDIPCKGL